METVTRSAPRPVDPARKTLLFRLVAMLLLIGGLALLVWPVRIPRPIRLGVAGTDLIAAAIIWSMARPRHDR